MKSDEPVYARLDVLLARDSSRALVLRRGPARHVASIGWDRATDSFTLGQWFKGRIYAYESDLSPDSNYFIYYARNTRDESWTAVSRWPYLKALDLYRNAWNGGGLFLDNTSYALMNLCPQEQARKNSKLIAKSCCYEQGMIKENLAPLAKTMWLRDGWIQGETPWSGKYSSINVFHKSLTDSWRLLRQACLNNGNSRHSGKGLFYDQYQIYNSASGETIACDDWEWADVDEWHGAGKQRNKRLVWAQKGKIFSAQIGDNGLENVKELYDFTSMQFEERIAPY